MGRRSDHDKLIEVLNAPSTVEAIRQAGNILVVTSPVWALLVLHPLAWEIDKSWRGTGNIFNAVYGTWVASEVLSKLGGLSALVALRR